MKLDREGEKIVENGGNDEYKRYDLVQNNWNK